MSTQLQRQMLCVPLLVCMKEPRILHKLTSDVMLVTVNQLAFTAASVSMCCLQAVVWDTRLCPCSVSQVLQGQDCLHSIKADTSKWREI